jgi:hypothetical protein
VNQYLSWRILGLQGIPIPNLTPLIYPPRSAVVIFPGPDFVCMVS